MREPIVELWPGRDGKWYFHQRNSNNRTTKPSQGYKQKRYAMVAIRRDIPGVKIVVYKAMW